MTISRIVAAVLLASSVACSTTPPRTGAETGVSMERADATTELPAPPAMAPSAVVTPSPATPTEAPESVQAPAIAATEPTVSEKPAPRVKTPKPVVASPVQPPASARDKPAVAATSGRISGKLELAAGPRQPVVAGEAAEGLVYFLPKAGAPRPKPGRFSIDTHSKGFKPALLVVPIGSTVSFPNKDDILHNVFSRTPGTSFDLGTYAPGQSKAQTFRKAGLVIVNCNVHSTMRANVVVLETPYYTRPGKDGRYELKNLPPGPGTLVFWHPRSAAQTVAVNGFVPVSRRLTATKASLGPHVH